MCSVNTFWIISFSFHIISVIVGMTCWIVGSNRPDYYHSGVMTTIPLFPTTPDGYQDYAIVTPIDGVDVYPEDNNTEVKIEIAYSNFISPKKTQTVYLLHNLWGYSINISIAGKNGEFLSRYTSRNMDDDYTNVVTPEYALLSDILPAEMVHQGDFFIRCPLRSLITSSEGAEPSCLKSIFGELIEISQPFQVIEIGDIVFHDIIPPIYLVFHQSKALPMNFVDVPQLFFASWKKSDSKKIETAGIVFAVIGITGIVVSAFILLCLQGFLSYTSTD